MAKLYVHWRHLILPKRGSTEAECEDAVAGDPTVGRYAVADGASESFAAGDWARILAKGFVANPPENGKYFDWLLPLRETWEQAVGERAQSWYAEEKILDGSHSTFLGVALVSKRQSVTWKAFAVGDSCLFQFRAGKLVKAFPIDTPTGFGYRPSVIRTKNIEPMWEYTEGELELGDTLYLATDAVAQAILVEAELNGAISTELSAMKPAQFKTWVEHARSSGVLRNDDVTLGIVELSTEPKPRSGR